MPSEILVGSFAGAILLVTIILYIPVCSVSGHTDVIDCLFTATSATCVTGLVAVDTGSHFTLVGRTVIITLIQLGGLGIMTASTFIMLLFGRSLSLRERTIVKDTLNPVRSRNLSVLVIYAVLFTVFVEAIGVAILYGAFKPIVGGQKAYGAAVFHSISAFCNAGFSTFSTNLESLRQYPRITLTIMSLLIIGGLGFFVILDLISGLKRIVSGRYLRAAALLTLHTRITLFVTACLLALGTLGLFLMERGRLFSDMSFLEAIRASLFTSATARTAGFSTVPTSRLGDASLFLLTLLMFVGASPGSTGGGIKTVTFALVVLFVIARIRGKSEVNVAGRRIPERVINKSLAIVSISLLFLSVCILILLVCERSGVDNPTSASGFIQVVFEATSAFGTVGLSTGITPNLTTAGKLVIIALMFMGRLGPLTVATIVATRARTSRYSFPEENVMVG